VNCFHDSLTPFGGGIALFDIALGEVAPGGIGAGMYGILVLAMVTVFVAGLMVGRTPEYIGKKIRPAEMKYASLYFLTLPVLILTMSAIAIGTQWGQSAIFNPGPHGLTEIVYAYASQANNNGSAFAGLGTGATFYQITGGITMLLGRFAPEIFALGLAGSLVLGFLDLQSSQAQNRFYIDLEDWLSTTVRDLGAGSTEAGASAGAAPGDMRLAIDRLKEVIAEGGSSRAATFVASKVTTPCLAYSIRNASKSSR